MPVIPFVLPRPNSQIIVTVELTGPKGTVEAKLILDTGATHTFIWPGYLKLAGYDPQKGKKERVVTASGRADIWPVDLDQMTVFGFGVRRFRVYAQDFPPTLQIDGVLGLNVFRKLKKTLRIDFLKMEIEVS
jgi:predicted aspartyl protease